MPSDIEIGGAEQNGEPETLLREELQQLRSFVLSAGHLSGVTR